MALYDIIVFFLLFQYEDFYPKVFPPMSPMLMVSPLYIGYVVCSLARLTNELMNAYCTYTFDNFHLFIGYVVFVCTYIHTYVYVSTYVNTYLSMYVYRHNVWCVRMYVYVYSMHVMYAYLCLYTYIHMYIRTYVYTHCTYMSPYN